jgi:hypothetical protein
MKDPIFRAYEEKIQSVQHSIVDLVIIHLIMTNAYVSAIGIYTTNNMSRLGSPCMNIPTVFPTSSFINPVQIYRVLYRFVLKEFSVISDMCY